MTPIDNDTIINNINIKKPISDHCLYRFITLSNKLQVLIIQDKTISNDNNIQKHHNNKKHSFSLNHENENVLNSINKNKDNESNTLINDNKNEFQSGSNDELNDELSNESSNDSDEESDEESDEKPDDEYSIMDENDEDLNDHETIKKKHMDEKKYSKNASAALSIGVGSFSDPPELPGLCHYLEHMLFMGSQKYPNENEFDTFLSSHGGYSNGSTDCETTTYLFEVGSKHLRKALDIFSQFFISPLFKKDSMDRELSAINYEFSRALQDDETRLQQIFCDTAIKNHPYHRFGWGNFKSLKENPSLNNVDVYTEIIKFYNKYYSANLMKLVVYGEDTLDNMEEWVIESFSNIENKNIIYPSFVNFGCPFRKPPNVLNLGLSNTVTNESRENISYYEIIPIRDMHLLQLCWDLPPLLGLHHQKPADYVAHLLGNEGKGSLLSMLKTRGWAIGLQAGLTETDGYEFGTFGSTFNMTIKLTKSGLTEWTSIINYVYEFINLIIKENYPAWVFEEMKAISELSFQFKEKEESGCFVEEIANIMQDRYKIEPSDLLRYQCFEGNFDSAQVKKIVSLLIPENHRTYLLSSIFDKTIRNDWSQEKWFGIKYRVHDVDKDNVSSWTMSLSGDNEIKASDIEFPLPNEFIPKDLSVRQKSIYADETILKYPISIYSSPLTNLYFKQDNVFIIPKLNAYFLISLKQLEDNMENLVCMELYLLLVKESLKEYTYQASVAELDFKMKIREGSSIEINFSGFNDKLYHLVNVVINKLFDFNNFDQICNKFKIFQNVLMEYYLNFNINPASKASYLRLHFLKMKHAFKIETVIHYLTNLKLNEWIIIIKSILCTSQDASNSRSSLQVLLHGNATKKEAIDMVQNVEKIILKYLNPPKVSKNNSNVELINLSNANSYQITYPSDHKDEVNSVIEIYYQIGEATIESIAYADVLHQLLEEPSFDTLRTKEQLGYQVHCSVRITNGIIGFLFHVQTAGYSCNFVQYRIKKFILDYYTDTLSSMDGSIFKRHIETQIQLKLQPNTNMTCESSNYWYEIYSNRKQFDINTKLVNVLNNITLQVIITKYQEIFLSGNILYKFVKVDKNEIVRDSFTKQKTLYVHVTGNQSKYDTKKENSNNDFIQYMNMLKDSCIIINDIFLYKRNNKMKKYCIDYSKIIK